MRNRREKEGPSPKLDAELHNVKIYWENWRKHFKQLFKAGIKIVAGADSGWENVRFGGFVYEIEAMQKGGLSTMEAIVSATQNAAESMGMGNLVGTLQPQKEADILVVRGNPLEDIMNLMQVEAVFKAGEKVEVSI
jgi:imidazolonepropionase-like amidohydrolase